MNIPIAHGASWYAVSTRSRHEKSAATMLTSLGVCHYLPLVREIHRWSDRKKAVRVPLFPGYLFVNIVNSSEARLHILRIPGVTTLVANGNGPAAIPDAEIENIRAVLLQDIECASYPYHETGDRVRIIRGALAGMEGRFLRSGADSKLVISVEMIQRSVAISVSECDIEPICETIQRSEAARQTNDSAICGA